MKESPDEPGPRGDHQFLPPGASKLTAVVLFAGIAAMLLLLHFGTATRSGIWFQTLYNTVHVPIFGIVGFLVFKLAGIVRPQGLGRRVAGSAIAVAGLAVASEYVQIATARNASILDVVVDLLSAASVIMLLIATEKSSGIGRRARRGTGLAGGLLLLLLFTPLVVVSVTVVDRDHRFPVLASFDTPLYRLFTRPRNADLVRVRGANGVPGDRVRVQLREGRWPGVAFSDLSRDWSDFETLVVDLLVPGNEPLTLNIRIHDATHDDRYGDRYNREFLLQPGSNALRIPIARIEAAPDARKMDTRNIRSMVIFSGPGNAGRVFEIREIRLE